MKLFLFVYLCISKEIEKKKKKKIISERKRIKKLRIKVI